MSENKVSFSVTQTRVFVSRKYGFTVRDMGFGYEFRSKWWNIETGDLQRIIDVVEVVHGSKVAYRLKRRFKWPRKTLICPN